MRKGKEPNFYYVYIITNLILVKQYVGSRLCYKDNVEDDDYWGSSKYLKEDYKIYGKENFIKEILQYDYIDISDMLDGETSYILKYNTLEPNGYNRYLPNKRKGFHSFGIDLKGEKNGMFGKHHSEETLQKLRKPKSEQAKLNMKGKNKGKTPWKGRHHTEETIKKMKNKTVSEESREKIRQSKIGKPSPLKGKKGLHKHTKETIIKISNKVSGEKNPMHGKTFYDVWIEKFGKEIADEKYEKWMSHMKGRKSWNKGKKYKGKPSNKKGKTYEEIYGIEEGKIKREKLKKSLKGIKRSEESKEKYRKSKLGKKHKKQKCPFCKKDIPLNNYKRYHGNNCKYKK